MSDTLYDCIRCEKSFAWELMKSTPEGNLFCPSCWKQITNEAKRKCPVDGVDMKKRLVADVLVIDVCGVCNGKWFDRSELEILLKKKEDESWDAGFVLGAFLL